MYLSRTRGSLSVLKTSNLGLGREKGATGLEPATSGVTGRFEGREVHDGTHGVALFMRLFRAVQERLAWLSGAVPGVCCPIAARRAPFRLLSVAPAWLHKCSTL